MASQFHAKAAHIHALLAQLGNFLQRGNRILPGDGVADLKQITSVGHTGHTAHQGFVHMVVHTGTGIQNGKCIAHGTVRQASDQLSCTGFQLNFFLLCHIGQPPRDILGGDAGKVVPLTAAQDGHRYFLHLGGGQNENHMLGRFLHRLEQGVEGLCGEHVHLVNDVYLIPAYRGQIRHFVPQVADIVHAVVGRGVHLDDVHDGTAVDAFTDLAFSAGIGAGMVQTVDRLSKNLGTGGLAGTAGTGKQVGMPDTAGGNLVLQRRDNGGLTHHIGKPLRTPLAIQRTIHRHTSPKNEKKRAEHAAALLCVQMQACRSTGRAPLNAARFPA